MIEESEAGKGYILKDSEGAELSFDQVSKIMGEVQEYFKDNKETID